MNSDLVVMAAASFARPGSEPMLRGITWTVRDGETWVVVGPTGSGKTTLVEAIQGLHRVVQGSIDWPIMSSSRANGKSAEWPSDVIRRLSFREDSRLFTYRGHYYQQRFEFGDPDVPTLGQYLTAGTGVTDAAAKDAADRLGLSGQLDLSLMKLSNGQTRRARLAQALLAKPELLILDDPFVGLDVTGRADVDELLGELVRAGQRVMLVCRPDQVPAWATHCLELKEGRVGAHGRLGSVSTRPKRQSPGIQQGADDPRSSAEEYVSLHHVTVRHAGQVILDDVSWTVRAGERWAVLGPNGAGKTTLLSLLCGDHPQTFAQDLRLFGRRRGSGETIWDVKRDVGLVSPEFHLYFSEPLSAFRTAATGFFDAVADRPTTPEQDAKVEEVFDAFRITHLRGRSFSNLSTGEQRLVLLARAVVKSPRLLILDEPFQGLDLDHVERLRKWLADFLRPAQALIFVTHDENEKPEGVTHTLRLENGKVATTSRCS